MVDTLSSPAPEATIQQPKAIDWLWHPWYSKLWWTAIPLYWITATASLKIPALWAFFESAFAGYLNVLFFPFTALLVLGFGFARAWLDALATDEWERLAAEEIRMWDDDWSDRKPGQPDPAFDIYDPRSGILYVGNPFGPNSGNYR
jgi:hypothetical protein